MDQVNASTLRIGLLAERAFSQNRACGLVQIDPEAVRREPEQGDAELRERLPSLAAERRRFGYRRLGIPLSKTYPRLSRS